MVRKTIFFIAFFCFLSVLGKAENEHIDSLKNVLSTAKEDSAKVEMLLDLSKQYYGSSLKEAMAYATHAKELAIQLNYRKGEAYAYKSIGIVYYIQDNYEETIRAWQKSLEVFEEIGDKVGIANIQSNIGAIYYNQKDEVKALDYYLKSLKTSEEVNDTFRILTACINIGAVYSDKPHTYSLALEYFERALPLAEALKDNESIGLAAVNLGDLHLKMDQYSAALKYLERATSALQNSQDLPYAINLIGMVYLKRKDFKSALKYFNQALELSRNLESKKDMAQAKYGIAEVYRQSGQFEQAIATYHEAEELARSVGDDGALDVLKDIYVGLGQAYSSVSEFGNAFKAQNLLIAVKDSIYQLDIEKKLNGLRFTFNIEKQENEINLLTKDKEIQRQEIARQKLVRNGFIGGFGIVLLFAGVFFTQRNRISKEKKRSDELLLNILPEETAEELKETGTAKTKRFDSVSVLFTDFKNFTKTSEKLTPDDLVAEINHCFSEFDKIVTKHGIEKIKTIGDAYMCAGGLPVENTTHAEDVIRAALEMQQFIERNVQERKAKGEPYFELRIGIHTGPVVAGVVGTKKFAYDIWGDTVNTASRMESNGEVGKVNISEATYNLVKDRFECEHRGKVQAKGKGELDMYFVEKAV